LWAQRRQHRVVVQEKVDGANLGIFYYNGQAILAAESALAAAGIGASTSGQQQAHTTADFSGLPPQLMFLNRGHFVNPNSATQWRNLESGWLNAIGDVSGTTVRQELFALFFGLATDPEAQLFVRQAEVLAAVTNAATASSPSRQGKRPAGTSGGVTTVPTASAAAAAKVLEEKLSEDTRSELAASDWVLYGEWLVARHTVAYDALPSPFLAFDLYHAPTQTFVAVDLLQLLLERYAPSVRCVPMIARWTQPRVAAAAVGDDDDRAGSTEEEEDDTAGDGSAASETGSGSDVPSASTAVPTWEAVHRAWHQRRSTFIRKLSATPAAAAAATSAAPKGKKGSSAAPASAKGAAAAAALVASTGICEGAVVRVEHGCVLLRRCKAVHDSFRDVVDEGTHWASRIMEKNGFMH
jgi:hypothetical protein